MVATRVPCSGLMPRLFCPLALPAPEATPEERKPELEPGEAPTPTEALVAQIMPPVDLSPTPGQALREQVDGAPAAR